MSKRTIYIITAVIIVVLLSLFFLFQQSRSTNNNASALVAIPPSSPLILSINDPLYLFENFESNEIYSTLKTIPSINSSFSSMESFFQFLKEDLSLVKFLKGKRLILSLNYSGKDVVKTLALISIQSSENDVYSEIVKKLENQDDITYNSRKYNRTNINEFTKNGMSFYVVKHKGLIMISDLELLVEEAIRLASSDLAIENEELAPLLKTAGSQSDIQLFINHSQADGLFSSQLSKSMQERSSLLKIFSGWTELDVNIKDNKIIFSGFSNGKSEDNYYSSIFFNQQPTVSKIEKVLPYYTPYYLGLTFSDVSKFFDDYKMFLEKRNLYFHQQDQLKKINTSINMNIQDVFEDLIDKEVVLAGIYTDENSENTGKVWIVETKSGSTSIQKIMEIQQAYIANNNLDKNNWLKDYQIDNQKSFTIYKFPIPNLPEALFGRIYKGTETNWVSIYDNHLIFGDSFQSVAVVIHSNILGETLSSNTDYAKFKTNLNNRSNLNFYCNTSISLPIASQFFNDKISIELKNNIELKKFKAFAWQISSSGNMLYNNSCLEYNSVVKSKPQTIWQSNINSKFDFKPTFVINHNDPQNKEIVLQDDNNILYLINNVGRIVWQLKLDHPILGDVHQIDLLKNGKLQFVFNTSKKLYLIDRTGNAVSHFPINLRADASNGVAIFDYENSKDYRFFIACTDHNIYAYDTDGNLLKGWNVFKTDHNVTQPLQHFRSDGKDYIVASDLMKDYILHRVGEIRVTTHTLYSHSANKMYLEERTARHEPRFVTTDQNGKIHYTYLDGKVETIEHASFSDDHSFTTANVDSDEEMEYVFTDKNQLTVLKNNGKVLLKKTFNSIITHKANIYKFSSNSIKIGITCAGENQIHLLDINGNEHPGFPLAGQTEFSIGFISNEKSNFNLLVGSPDGYLYNYYVE